MNNNAIKQREHWVRFYVNTHDAGLVCRRCGISRPTLRKWWNRYKAEGLDGLKDRSKRPHNMPATKITANEEEWILELRKRNLGARRIRGELKREYAFCPIKKKLDKTKTSTLSLIDGRLRRFFRHGRFSTGSTAPLDISKAFRVFNFELGKLIPGDQ